MDQLPPAQLDILAKENRGPGSVGLVVTFTVLAFICVGLRLFSQFYLVRNVGLEDYFITISMVWLVFPS